jgi:hypothetical protein
MLIELGCSKFLVSPVRFKEGLNVVVGDAAAANSIGKSSLLLLIDFAFGGSDFIKFDNGAILNLGHHEYDFCFLFDDVKYYYKRKTDDPAVVFECSKDYVPFNQMSLDVYTDFLANKYNIDLYKTSFRKFVGLFSRVWGKSNLDVSKPLNIVPAESMASCVTDLIDFFGQYKSISDLDTTLKLKTEEKRGLLGAYKYNYIERINKRKYEQNSKAVKVLSEELDGIRDGLARRMCNINQILNDEVADLKVEKDRLVNEKMLAVNKLDRVDKNIKDATFKHTGEISRLKSFFPDIDESRLEKVDGFHAGISKILLEELKKSRDRLSLHVLNIENSLDRINSEINSKISAVTNASPLVDKIFAISTEFDSLVRENSYYETEQRLKSEEKHLKELLNDLKINILNNVQNSVNGTIQALVRKVYGEERQSPALNLESGRYSFRTVADTGTGKSYSNLILFDLAIFELTSLPIVVHDSVLFKNIEHRAVDGLVGIYLNYKKQSFISIDEIVKYSNDTQVVLLRNKVLSLSNDKLLYVKDWRKKS